MIKPEEQNPVPSAPPLETSLADLAQYYTPFITPAAGTADTQLTIEAKNQVFLALMNAGVVVDPESQSKIAAFVQTKAALPTGVLLCELYQHKLIKKSVLFTIKNNKHELQKDPHILGWWHTEKSQFRARHLSGSNPQNLKLLTEKDFPILFGGKHTEIKLVEEFEKSLTKYAQENFYVYRSGNSYYYSVNPAEDSIGGRCDQQGRPLVDEFGNDLTDEFGNFRYAIINYIESASGFQETKQIVPQGTPGATPLTDKNGVALANKYRELIKRDLPKKVDRRRAEATNYLFQLIRTASAEDIYRYITTPNFQSLIGADEYNFTWYTLLKHICKNYVWQYEQMAMRVSDYQLAHLFLDEKLYAKLQPEQLTYLFWHHNSFLVADAIVNLYQREDFSGEHIKYKSLVKLLNGDNKVIERVNKRKCELKAQLLLPADACIPGKNTIEEERLTKRQLFQYDESTIAAAEAYLRTTFSYTIINSSPNSIGFHNPNATMLFYLVPANSYMLMDPVSKIDPKNSQQLRYQNYKHDIRSLVSDPAIGKLGVPLIFTGVINIDGNHYIAYFIYRNRSGKVFVHVVDPSPHVYPEHIQDKVNVDKKIEHYKRARIIFNDIFPNCEFFDPLVAQMDRERNCGPCSLQTVYDGLSKSQGRQPLVYVDETDSLIFNPQGLTLRAHPCGINFYSKTYVYHADIGQKSNQIRALWESRLNEVSSVLYYAYRSEGRRSIYDQQDLVPDPYNYNQLVNAQQSNDERNNNISAINCILMSDEAGKALIAELKEGYRKTLTFTNLDKIIEFLKSKIDALQLDQYTSAHQKNIVSLAEDVATVLVHEIIAESLQTALQNQELKNLRYTPTLTAEDKVTAFLAKHQVVYKKLPPNDQLLIKDLLKRKADLAVQEKSIDHHLPIIRDVLTANCLHYLTQLSAPGYLETAQDLADILVARMSADDLGSFFSDQRNRYKVAQINQAITYLKTYALPLLKAAVHEIVSQRAEDSLQLTLAQKSFPNLETMWIKDFLNFFDPNKLTYIPPAPEAFLKNDSPADVLRLNQVSSALGMWMVPRLNLTFYRQVIEYFPTKITQQVNAFIAQTPFLAAFASGPLHELDGKLTPDNRLKVNYDFRKFIEMNSNEQTLTLDYYQHPTAHGYFHSALLNAICQCMIATINNGFMGIAQQVVVVQFNILSFQSLSKAYDLNYDLTMQMFATARQVDPSIEDYFLKNFMVNQYNNVPNSIFSRLHNFFTQTYSQVILNHYQLVKRFKSSADIVLDAFGAKELLSNKSCKDILDSYRASFIAYIAEAEKYSLLGNFEEDFAALIKRFHDTLRSMITSLMKTGYVPGDTVPAQLTSVLRSILCGVLGIETPPVMLPSAIKKLDVQIIKAIEAPYFTQNARKSTLIMLPYVKAPADTYDKPINTMLLVHLLGVWFSYPPSKFNIISYLNPDNMPPLIMEIIKVVNANPISETPLPLTRLEGLKREVLPPSDMEQLAIFEETSLAGVIRAALLKTRTFTEETSLVTPLSAKAILTMLRGGAVKSLLRNPDDAKEKVTLEEFNRIVIKEMNARETAAQEEAEQRRSQVADYLKGTIQPVPVILQVVRTELLNKYLVPGLTEVLPVISNAEFEAKVIDEYRRRNRIVMQLPEGQPKRLPTLPEVRTDLRKKFLIAEEQQQQAEEEAALLAVPKEQLQRGYFSSWFGRTELEASIQTIIKRHNGGDHIDEWDIQQLRLRLQARWQGLCIREKDAARNHYLKEKPNYIDSGYIALATIIAQHSRKQGELVFVYHLLMPNYFLSPDSLKTTKIPESIVNALSNVSENDVLYDTDKNAKANLNIEMTIDDIPLQNLLILRSGYALDINWVVAAYTKHSKLINPYINLEYSKEDIDDILSHPQSCQLVTQLKARYVPHLTRRAILLLRDYLNGTVFENGFRGTYNNEQMGWMEKAAERFTVELGKLHPEEAKALMDEPVPFSNNSTVGSLINSSRLDKSCATLRGADIAKVVIAYEGLRTSGLNSHIVEYVIRKLSEDRLEIPPRHYKEIEAKLDTLASPAEQYLLDRIQAQSLQISKLQS